MATTRLSIFFPRAAKRVTCLCAGYGNPSIQGYACFEKNKTAKAYEWAPLALNMLCVRHNGLQQLFSTAARPLEIFTLPF